MLSRGSYTYRKGAISLINGSINIFTAKDKFPGLSLKTEIAGYGKWKARIDQLKLLIYRLGGPFDRWKGKDCIPM